MDQWPSTDYQKPLPLIKRIMPGRPPHKRKRYVMEYDGNRTKIRTASVGQVSATGEIVSASVGKVTATGEIVCASGGNVTASGEIVSARGGNVSARGGKVSARGCKITARGGIVTASGGNVTARGGKVIASGGKVTVIGRKVTARGGKVSATPSKPSTSPCTLPHGFKMSTPDTASSVVRISGGVIKLREGVWIRSPKKERSSNADSESSSSMNKLRTMNGKVVSSRGIWVGSKSRMYPGGIRPIGFGVFWDLINGKTMLGSEIALTQSQLVVSQDQEEPSQQQLRQQELRQQQPRQQQPRQQQPMIRRTSERIAQIMFNKPPSPGPGLDLDDAISIE
ncbi:tetratricopeptide-like helical domain, DYW domain protein [Tanacetum coccineum]